MKKLLGNEPPLTKTSLYLPDELRQAVKAAAKANGRTMNAEILARVEEAEDRATFKQLVKQNDELRANARNARPDRIVEVGAVVGTPLTWGDGMKRTIIASILLAQLGMASAGEKVLYHVRNDLIVSAWGCNDKLATAQLNDASRNPGHMSVDHIAKVARQFNCGPLSPLTEFSVLRSETFDVPAGRQEVVFVELPITIIPNGGVDHFYLMKSDIAPVKTAARHE